MKRLALLACLIASPAFAQIDHGGRIVDYDDLAQHPSAISGICESACTMKLLHGCVYPDALLGFHSVGSPDGSYHWVGNEVMLMHYPPRLRAVVRPWLESHKLHFMRGDQAIALGARRCG